MGSPAYSINRKSIMKIIVVLHGKKVDGLAGYHPALASDPPMSMDGKAKMLELAEQLRQFGDIHAAYCSLMDRACGTMCTIAKVLKLTRVICIAELGQLANLDSDGTITTYPGHELDDVPTVWQRKGLSALAIIEREVAPDSTVMVFTHRPILAGLIASARGETNPERINALVYDKSLFGKGYRVFDVQPDDIRLLD